MAHSPDVSVENVEADILSGSAIGIDVTSVLPGPWCTRELYQPTMTPEGVLNGHLICLAGLGLLTPEECTLCRIHIHQTSW
jgi:hypothetical protein